MHAWMLGKRSRQLHHILNLASGVCIAAKLHFGAADQAMQADEDEMQRRTLQHRRLTFWQGRELWRSKRQQADPWTDVLQTRRCWRRWRRDVATRRRRDIFLSIQRRVKLRNVAQV